MSTLSRSRRRHSSFWTELGPGGLSSLSLALAAGLLGAGLPVAWRLRQVLRCAAGEPLRHSDAIVVLGRELVDDEITPVFRARLEQGALVWRQGWAERLVVAGGMTGVATRSEAAAGRTHLLALGVPDPAIWVEERSRFTLENLVNVRTSLRGAGLNRVVLVSDPLHLARATALARGLALEVVGSPAVAAPPTRRSLHWWLRAWREAFLLHWYHVGVAYSRALGSERLLSRVT